MWFFLDDELGVARGTGAELGGQRNGLVEAVGVRALRAAEEGCISLITSMVVRTMLL